VLQRSYRSTTKVAGYILQAVVWILGRRRGSLFSVERGQRKVLEREREHISVYHLNDGTTKTAHKAMHVSSVQIKIHS
jgi:hypothetical protein